MTCTVFKYLGVSMETNNLIQACLSPPLRTVAKTEPYIPISTNIVRGVLDSPSKVCWNYCYIWLCVWVV